MWLACLWEVEPLVRSSHVLIVPTQVLLAVYYAGPSLSQNNRSRRMRAPFSHSRVPKPGNTPPPQNLAINHA